MRGKSHKTLGTLLADRYMPHTPKRFVKAFLIGCVEPDRNPTTYLKGSVRRDFLRGHNYENARRYMCRIARRLERKRVYGLWDYYRLGKLIHYTADAFTFAHNSAFGTRLREHRQYEHSLQEHFLRYLEDCPHADAMPFSEIARGIRILHRDYSSRPRGIQTDSHFALNACSSVLATLFSPITP